MDSGAGCVLHQGTTHGGGLLNVTDIKNLCIYCDSIPVGGSILRKGVLKFAMAPYSPLGALPSPKKAPNVLTEGTP